jgi:hypothetical protein
MQRKDSTELYVRRVRTVCGPHYTERVETNRRVEPRARPKENYLVMVLFLSAVLGMAVAVAVYWGWRSGTIAPGFHDFVSAFALLVCPPFILSVAVGPAPDSLLALALVVGTIVFANAFLYAGVAAAGYFVAMQLIGRSRNL